MLVTQGGWERGFKTLARPAKPGEARVGFALASVEVFDAAISGSASASGPAGGVKPGWRPAPRMCKERAGCTAVLMPHGLICSAVVLGHAEVRRWRWRRQQQQRQESLALLYLLPFRDTRQVRNRATNS